MGALVVYDIADRSSFESIPRWLTELRAHADSNVVTMLIGNKCDRSDERQVSIAEATELASAQSLSFLETSALDATNVDESFRQVLEEIYRRKSANKPAGHIPQYDRGHDSDDERIKLEPRPRKSKSSSCC